MINWRTIVGGLLIFGGLQEIFRVICMYNSGEIKSWPFGAELGTLAVFAAGYFLIRSGIKKAKDKTPHNL